MSLTGTSLGRQDQGAPLVSWRVRANITMGLLAGSALLAWHAAVFLTADGVGLTDLRTTARALLHGRPLAGLAGAHPASATRTLAVWGVLLVVLFAGFIAWAFTFGAWRARRRRGKGFADNSQIRDGLGLAHARASAAQTRPGLSAAERKRVPIERVGLPLGTSTTGEPVVLSLEDHAVVIAPTGAGKSVEVMIPAALTAPGALVVTCTRADILDVIAETRTATARTTASGTGNKRRIWVFDPLDRLGWPEPMVWNPVAGCRDGQTAVSRGLAFAAGIGADDRSSTNSSFFRANAASALTRLLHAADLDGRPVADVIDWAVHLDDGAEEAQNIIRHSVVAEAEPLWAGMLRSVATGAEETVSSSRQTLAQAIEPMALRSVLRWVTPRDGVPAFDVAGFVAGTDTLVLVGDANASTNVAPLCAMLLQEVVDTAKTVAARLPGGRLDPPLRLVGDEIANVAPLPKLVELATDARGFGMQLVLALQSLPQARRRWGADGANTLLDNMPAEILLGGITDPDTLGRYATLVGDVELTRATTSYDPDSGRATGASEQQTDRRVLRAEEARQIPAGHGLLIYRNRPAVLLRLTAWFDRTDARALDDQRRTTQNRRLAADAGTG